jgi:hypothetical protein
MEQPSMVESVSAKADVAKRPVRVRREEMATIVPVQDGM